LQVYTWLDWLDLIDVPTMIRQSRSYSLSTPLLGIGQFPHRPTHRAYIPVILKYRLPTLLTSCSPINGILASAKFHIFISQIDTVSSTEGLKMFCVALSELNCHRREQAIFTWTSLSNAIFFLFCHITKSPRRQRHQDWTEVICFYLKCIRINDIWLYGYMALHRQSSSTSLQHGIIIIIAPLTIVK